MTAPRPTPLGLKIVSIADNVVLKLIGLIIFAGSGYFLYLEFMLAKLPNETLHTAHIALFLTSGVFGLVLAFRKPVVDSVKTLVGVASPFIPRFGKKPDGGDQG